MSIKKYGFKFITVSSLVLSMPIMAHAQDTDKLIPKPASPSQMRQREETTTETNEPEEPRDDESEEAPEPTNSDIEDGRSSEDNEDDKDEEKDKEATDNKKSLFDGEIVVYSNNVFENKENFKEFVKYLEGEEHTKGQFKLQEDEENLTLAVNYTQDAKEDKQAIVYYEETSFDNEDKAQRLIDDSLKLYPDLFFQGEPVKSGDKYDIALGLRTTVNSQAVWYDEEANQIKYIDKRKPYTYIIKKGEEDQYKPAIQSAFPDAFEFKEEETDDGKKVTMKQVEVSRESQQTNVGRSFVQFPSYLQPAVNILNDGGDKIYAMLESVNLAKYLDGFNVVGDNAWVLTLVSLCVLLALILIVIEIFK